MPSFIGRPDDLVSSGPLVPIRLWIPEYVAAERTIAKQPIASPIEAVGLIDTGGNWTVIEEGTAARLGLTPVGTSLIHTVSALHEPREQYYVQLQFPHGYVTDVLAIEAPFPEHDERYAQCVIGRDALKHCLLIYNGMTNMYSLIL